MEAVPVCAEQIGVRVRWYLANCSDPKAGMEQSKFAEVQVEPNHLDEVARADDCS